MVTHHACHAVAYRLVTRSGKKKHVCDRDVDIRARIIVHLTIYRRLRIGRDNRLDLSEAYTIYRQLYETTRPGLEFCVLSMLRVASFISIVRRYYWSSLACIYTTVVQIPIPIMLFHYLTYKNSV